MPIQHKHLQHWINNFYGYGSWNARIWFVAYEEDGGDTPEEVDDKFTWFYKEHSSAQPALCDLRELYRQVSVFMEGPRASLFTTLYDYRFGSHAGSHGIWKNLIAFVHGYRNEELPDLIRYQLNSFSGPSSYEAWIKLYPLPSTHNHAWYYSWLDMPGLTFLKSRSLYENHVYHDRMSMILRQISIHKPEVVMMYGMDNINLLKKSVCEFFPDAKFSMVKAVKQLPLASGIPQYHCADFQGTTLLITTQIPALRHNRVETGFDWLALGKKVKSEKLK